MENQNYPQNGIEKRDIWAMGLALDEARAAAVEGEVPIGAVLMHGDAVIAAAHNHRERDNDVTSHAEIEVLRLAGKRRGDWRLSECTLYVTLEPCPMCAGAILAARIGRVVFGAKDATMGAMGSVLNLPRFPLGSRPAVEYGLLEAECKAVLQDFFKNRRKEKNS